ncbi:FAD-dependent oxidoreductase [Candidatus Poribacteria bacterium]
MDTGKGKVTLDMVEASDVLIVGGGFAGCLTALACAEEGLSVTIIERRGYPGREVTAKLRQWVKREGFDQMRPELKALLLPPGEKREIDAEPSEIPDCFSEEIPLFCGSIKKCLLEALLKNGVKTILMSDVAGVLASGDSALGLLLANKYGLQVIRGKLIIDASEGHKALGYMSDVRSDSSSAHYVIGFSGARLPDKNELQVPEEMGVVGDLVRIHPGKSRSCNALVEFGFKPGTQVHSLSGATAREYQARQLAVNIAQHLIHHSEYFQNALMSELANETAIKSSRRGIPTDLPGNFLVPKRDLPFDFSCSDLMNVQESCQQLAAEVKEIVGSTAQIGTDTALCIRSGETAIPLNECRLSDFDDPKLGIPLQSVEFNFKRFLPTAAKCEVLVAGGGTAGACAGIAAAENGADVIVAETNCDLGGTQTLGGISSYYHGYQDGFTKILNSRMAAFGKSIYGKPVPKHIAKMLLYEKELVEKGGRLFLNTSLCGTSVENGAVKGCVAVNDAGMFIIEARVTVDATGDGDIAVFSGAEYTYGNPRNGNVQDYSQFGKGNAHWIVRSSDLDVINHRKMSELMRGLIITHQKAPHYDFVPMLTVRESRHIEGEYTLDLLDIYEGRNFHDAIAVAMTDWDVHGISSSWLGRLGFMPVHMKDSVVQIPYRCCIPRGLDGLLISAKAISATTDAACYCRMAADVQNLGYANGLAAAMAAKEGGGTRKIDVPLLRQRLSELGILPAESLGEPEVSGSAEQRIVQLANGDESALFSVVLLPKERAMPLLEAAFRKPDTDRLCIARAMAWFGSGAGMELLIENLRVLNHREGAAAYDDTHPYKTGNPKAGIIDRIDDYWRINQLLILLGILRDPAAIEVICDVVEKAEAGGEPKREATPYVSSRIDMQRVPHFDRLLCIAFALERLASRRFVPSVEELLDKSYIGGYLSRTNKNAGFNYHGAYAEVSLAAAAARCGSIKGAQCLAEYLDDVHEILSTFAYQELREITCEDFGRDSSAWLKWLAGQEALSPVPYKGLDYVF